MITCKICGHSVKYRLIEHIQKTHKLDIETYKKDYGEVISEEYKEMVSNNSKEKWKNEEYRENVLESRNWIYSDVELNKRRIESIKKYYKNGGKTWNDGLTKDTDKRLFSIGEKNRENLTGRTKEQYDYLKKHSDLMKSIWNSSKLKKVSENKSEEHLKKISSTITNKILNGEINTFSGFKNGWYNNKNGDHWYSSSLELNSMMLMDKLNINWIKNNKIKIKYIKENREHFYIPDFIININDTEYIIEMKGFDWDGDTELKNEYAKNEYENYHIFYSIKELEKFINKINKNEML